MKRSLILYVTLTVLFLTLLTSGSNCDIIYEEEPTPATVCVQTTPLMMRVKPMFMVSMDDAFGAAIGAVSEIEEEKVEEPDPIVMYFTEDEVIMVAKLLKRECNGMKSDTEKACVVWVACNRVDSDAFRGDTITEIVTAENQFAYYYNTPVEDELYELALDVLTRWNAERNGEESVGRVLPADYTFFAGDGVHNYFRNAYRSPYTIWDYSLPSPYDS